MKKLISGIVLLFAFNTNAAVIDFTETTSPRLDTEYLISSSDTHIDVNTGLEWLDFGDHHGNSTTMGWSIEGALTTYSSQDFRLATESEVSNLFSFFYPTFVDSGNGSMTIAEDVNNPLIQERNSWLLGFGTDSPIVNGTIAAGEHILSTGLYMDDDGSVQFAGWGITIDPSTQTKFYSTAYTVSGLSATQGYNQFGVFMVRDTGRHICNPDIENCNPVVPIPAAFWLMGAGLVSLFVVAWRRT